MKCQLQEHDLNEAKLVIERANTRNKGPPSTVSGEEGVSLKKTRTSAAALAKQRKSHLWTAGTQAERAEVRRKLTGLFQAHAIHDGITFLESCSVAPETEADYDIIS